MDDGGIPPGALDHEKPWYWRNEYSKLEKECDQLKKNNDYLRQKGFEDAQLIKKLKDSLHEFIDSIENRVKNKAFAEDVRCPYCGYEWTNIIKEK